MSFHKIVVDCTNSDADIGLAELDALHETLGYKRHPDGFCKYHYIVRKCGEVQVGRNDNLDGWHTYKEEKGAIIICIVGQEASFSAAQKASLASLVFDLSEDHPIRTLENAVGSDALSFQELKYFNQCLS